MTVTPYRNESSASAAGAASPSSQTQRKTASSKSSNPSPSPVDLHAGPFECARIYVQNCFKAIEKVRDEKSFESSSQNPFSANVLKERTVNLRLSQLEDLRSEVHQYGTTLIDEEKKSTADSGKTILKLAVGIIGYMAAAFFRESLNPFSVMEDQPMKNIAVTLVQITSGIAVLLAIVDLCGTWQKRRRPSGKIECIEKVMNTFNDVLADAEKNCTEREIQHRDLGARSTSTTFSVSFSPIDDLNNLAKHYEGARCR